MVYRNIVEFLCHKQYLHLVNLWLKFVFIEVSFVAIIVNDVCATNVVCEKNDVCS